MSALTLDEIAALPLDGSLWNSFGVVEPEFPACSSRLRMLNGDPTRSAACAVSHAETGEAAHGAMVGPHFMRWTDREAEVAQAWFELLPKCTTCQAPYRPADKSPFCSTRCQLADKHTFDEYETEAAA